MMKNLEEPHKRQVIFCAVRTVEVLLQNMNIERRTSNIESGSRFAPSD